MKMDMVLFSSSLYVYDCCFLLNINIFYSKLTSKLKGDDKLSGFVGISSELGSTLNVLLFTFDDVGVLDDDHITVQSVFSLAASALAFRSNGNLGDFVPDALVLEREFISVLGRLQVKKIFLL